MLTATTIMKAMPTLWNKRKNNVRIMESGSNSCRFFLYTDEMIT